VAVRVERMVAVRRRRQTRIMRMVMIGSGIRATVAMTTAGNGIGEGVK
jgi:hypothetical protein